MANDGTINGVKVSGYERTEDVCFEIGPGKYFKGTYVYGPTGASVFIRQEESNRNQENGASINFSRGSVFAQNLYNATIYGVPEKQDRIALFDCEHVSVDTENLKETREKYGTIDFDSNGNPIMESDNDIITVRYTQNGKHNSNEIQGNKGDRVNGQVFDKNSWLIK